MKLQQKKGDNAQQNIHEVLLRLVIRRFYWFKSFIKGGKHSDLSIKKPAKNRTLWNREDTLLVPWKTYICDSPANKRKKSKLTRNDIYNSTRNNGNSSFLITKLISISLMNPRSTKSVCNCLLLCRLYVALARMQQLLVTLVPNTFYTKSSP